MSLNQYLNVMSKDELEIAVFEYQDKVDKYNQLLKGCTDCFVIQEFNAAIDHYVGKIELIQIKLKERF